jgi:hypothetical protein
MAANGTARLGSRARREARSFGASLSGAAAAPEYVSTYAQVCEWVHTQALLPNLAVHAGALLANGRVTEAQAGVDEVLAANPGQLAPCNPDWCESLAIVLHDVARGGEFMAAVPRAHPNQPWVVAAHAVAEGEFAQAADQYASIGSGADEAYARLRAGEQLAVDGQGVEAVEQLKRAADFLGRAGALAYLSQAEDLLRRAGSTSCETPRQHATRPHYPRRARAYSMAASTPCR